MATVGEEPEEKEEEKISALEAEKGGGVKRW
jgi:hypothetical protein